MLDFHLYKRKKPCVEQNDNLEHPHTVSTSSTQIHTKLWNSTQIHTNLPENSRIIPVKLPTFPENSRFIPVKSPTFPENSRLTKKNFKTLLNNEETSLDSIENEIVELPCGVSKKEHVCPQCGQKFSRSDSMKRHLEKYCKMKDLPSDMIKLQPNQQSETTKLEEEISLLKKRIEEMEKNDQKHLENFEKLKSEPRVIHNHNNQILQILCVGGNQNYLNMLTEQWGDYDKALCFIKDCALSSLNGDCKLLEKIYFSSDNPSEFPIKYLDKNRKKLEYLNENKERIVDPQGTRLAKILANNLQNSYLQGVNYLINQTLENKNCPNHFLDEYDIQSWNNHIYELSDSKYQKKIISCLEIPTVN